MLRYTFFMFKLIFYLDAFLINYLLLVVSLGLIVNFVKPIKIGVINILTATVIICVNLLTKSYYGFLALALLPVVIYWVYAKCKRTFALYYIFVFVYSVILLSFIVLTKLRLNRYVILIIVSAVASVLCLSLLFTKQLFRSKIYTDFYFNSVVKINNDTIKLRLYLDTGNFLYDKKTHLPIVLVSLNILRLKYLKVEDNLQKLSIFDIDFINDKESVYLYRNAHIYVKVNGVWHGSSAVLGVIDKDFFIADGLMGLDVIK